MAEQSAIDDAADPKRISTGSAGLDDILGGGFDSNRMYLYEGRPGTGKTTIALQFLLEGVRLGERVLYITLSETKRELTLVAKRHNWSLKGLEIFELVPPDITLDPERELTVLHPSEVDLSETTKLIFERVSALNPTRVVVDSLSELRLLAQNPLRYRRQVLSLKHFFASRQCTVVLLDDLSSAANDLQLHSISHGVVLLEQLAIEYGAERRRLRVVKMRGIDFRGGFHDFTIEQGGLAIFPRLIAAEHHTDFAGEYVSSGNAELDRLLGGGLERGTNALLIGSAGVGKSSLALTYAVAAAQRGEKSVFFAFDEGRGTLEARAREVGRGTSVALLLPRAMEKPANEATGVSDLYSQRKRSVSAGSVLLVEDDDDVAAMVSEMLDELGYEVTRVASSSAALGALANGRRIDMVFSDIMMPGDMDGVDLGREVRQRRSNVPVLLTSGYAEASAPRAEIEGFGVLRKPYSLSDLAAALKMVRQESARG